MDRSLLLGNLHGMDSILRGQCVHRFFTTEGGECHPRFALAAVLPSLVTHNTLLLLLPTLASSVVQFLGYIIVASSANLLDNTPCLFLTGRGETGRSAAW